MHATTGYPEKRAGYMQWGTTQSCLISLVLLTMATMATLHSDTLITSSFHLYQMNLTRDVDTSTMCSLSGYHVIPTQLSHAFLPRSHVIVIGPSHDVGKGDRV